MEPELPPDLEGPVTTAVTRRIKPGHEAAYEGAAKALERQNAALAQAQPVTA